MHPAKTDPLTQAESAIQAELPRLARIAIRRAAAGKPAALLKVVRQIVRELLAARSELEARKKHELLGTPTASQLTPFERRLIRDLRKLFAPGPEDAKASKAYEQLLREHRQHPVND